MTERAAGRVYLVGAGPGDPGLLTRRGAETLRTADLVVYDGLVNPALLREAPPGAERIAVGRAEGVRILSQAAVNELLVEAARAGRTVVRLKGGDPYVFGRGSEEALALAAAGLPFEVVPGVSSFHAVPAYAGIPLTDPASGPAGAIQVLSGHEDPAKAGSDLDWAAAARLPGTKVILMGVERLPAITAALLAGGLPPDEPVALIRRGTTPDQSLLTATLATVADLARDRQFGPPAVTVIGPVVRRQPDLDWFSRRPLLGRRVVVTRARDDAGPLVADLAALGAEVWEIPAIERGAPEDPAPAEAAARGAAEYEWIVFTSPAGVGAFMERVLALHGDLRALGNARLAAVGPATAARLREYHLRVDAMPARFLGREVARAMEAQGNLRDLRVLLARAQVAGSDLVEELERLGAMVDDVAFYRTRAASESDSPAWAGRLAESGADWITFTSASTVEGLHAGCDLPALARRHPQLRFASLGPETSRALTALGLTAHVEANPHTTAALVEALAAAGPSC